MPTAMSLFGPGYQSRYGVGGGGGGGAARPTVSPSAGDSTSAYWNPENLASLFPATPAAGGSPNYAGMSEDQIDNLFGVGVDRVSGQRVSRFPLTNWAEYRRAISIATGRGGLIGPGGPGARYGVGPNGQPNTYGQRIKQLVDEGRLPYSALFGVAQLPEALVPGAGFEDIAAKTGAEMDAASAAAVPDFNALKKEFADKQAKLNASYDASSVANRGAVDLAGRSVADYETKGKAALDTGLANARDLFANTQKQADNILNRGQQYMSRYGAAAGGGAGSEYAGLFANATLPAILAANERGYSAIGGELARYQPFYGDVASRQFQLAGFQQAASQQDIANMRQQVLDAGLPEKAFNEILQQQQALKQGELSIRDLAAAIQQKYGAQRFPYYVPGADVAQTGQTNLPMPRYPNADPGRYFPAESVPAESGTSTGTTQSGAAPIASDPLAEAIQRQKDYYASLKNYGQGYSSTGRNPYFDDVPGYKETRQYDASYD